MRCSRLATSRVVRELIAMTPIEEKHRSSPLDHSDTDDVETATRIANAVKRVHSEKNKPKLSFVLPSAATVSPPSLRLLKSAASPSLLSPAHPPEEGALLLQEVEQKKEIVNSIGVSTLMVLGGLDKLRWKRQKEKEEEGESQTDAAMLANYRAQWDEMDEVTKLKLVLKSTQGRRMTLSLQRSMDAYIEWKSNPNGTHNKEERGESLVEALKQRYHYKGLLHRPLPAGARRNLPDLVRPLRNGELLEKLIFSENPNEKDAPRWVRAAPYQATIRATMQATDGGWKQREQNSEWDRQVRKLFEGNDLAGYLAMKNRVGETNNGGGEGDLSDVHHKNAGEGSAPILVDDETIRLWENLRVDSPRHIYVRNMLFETHFRDREKHHRSPKEVESLARDFSAEYDTHLQKIREGVQEKYTTQEHNAHFVEEKVTAATNRYKRELIVNEIESLGQRLEDFMKCVPMLQQALSTMNGTEEASSGGGGIKVRKSANPPRKRGKG